MIIFTLKRLMVPVDLFQERRGKKNQLCNDQMTLGPGLAASTKCPVPRGGGAPPPVPPSARVLYGIFGFVLLAVQPLHALHESWGVTKGKVSAPPPSLSAFGAVTRRLSLSLSNNFKHTQHHHHCRV